MNNREAHFYLEELQRMMTQHRCIFSEEFVRANGMAIQALECNITSDVVPSAQPERYTKEELRVFQHGISLSLLSKRSAQHWQYDEDTATEIKFLERLYEKVGADIRGEEE